MWPQPTTRIRIGLGMEGVLKKGVGLPGEGMNGGMTGTTVSRGLRRHGGRPR